MICMVDLPNCRAPPSPPRYLDAFVPPGRAAHAARPARRGRGPRARRRAGRTGPPSRRPRRSSSRRRTCPSSEVRESGQSGGEESGEEEEIGDQRGVGVWSCEVWVLVERKTVRYKGAFSFGLDPVWGFCLTQVCAASHAPWWCETWSETCRRSRN